MTYIYFSSPDFDYQFQRWDGPYITYIGEKNNDYEYYLHIVLSKDDLILAKNGELYKFILVKDNVAKVIDEEGLDPDEEDCYDINGMVSEWYSEND